MKDRELAKLKKNSKVTRIKELEVITKLFQLFLIPYFLDWESNSEGWDKWNSLKTEKANKKEPWPFKDKQKA